MGVGRGCSCLCKYKRTYIYAFTCTYDVRPWCDAGNQSADPGEGPPSRRPARPRAHARACTYINTYTNIHTENTCAHAKSALTHTRAHTHTHTNTRARPRSKHTRAHTHTHTHHTHTHTPTHPHTQKPTSRIKKNLVGTRACLLLSDIVPHISCRRHGPKAFNKITSKIRHCGFNTLLFLDKFEVACKQQEDLNEKETRVPLLRKVVGVNFSKILQLGVSLS